MYLTKSEIEIEEAKKQGRRDFERYNTTPSKDYQGKLLEAWKIGWSEAKRDYDDFYSDEYYR